MKSALVIQSHRKEAFIAKGGWIAVSEPSAPCVHISRDRSAAVILAGQRGPQGVGIPGPAGGSAVQRAFGETLSALVVVYELNGQVFALDYRDPENIDLMLGVTINAGVLGSLGNIQRSGVIDDSGWSWTSGAIWLGADGALTQVSPIDGYDVLIGSANSATRITLNLQDPIELE